MIDKNYMRDEVQSLLHRERWDTVYKLTVDREKEMKQLFTGMMNSDTWELKIVLDEKFESKEAEVLAKTKLQVDEPYQKLARALARHELGHWMHCPLDASYVPLLFDAVSNGLKEASFDESEIAQSAPYVMNMFSDTLVNMLEGKDSEYSEGQTTIYNTFFYTGMDRSGHVPEYFSMFVDTWMNFIGKSKVERNLVKDFAGDYKKVEAVSRELLESIMGKTLAERTISNSLNEVERGAGARHAQGHLEVAQDGPGLRQDHGALRQGRGQGHGGQDLADAHDRQDDGGRGQEADDKEAA